MIETHPHAMNETAYGKKMTEELSNTPGICDYRRLDDGDTAQVHELAAQRRSGPFVFGPGASRALAELRMNYVRWLIAGGYTFVVGPETAARITARLSTGDVPTSPVPPAYFAFTEPMAQYAPGQDLRGAYISRGIVGRMTFMNRQDVSGQGAITVLTPSVFRAGHVGTLGGSLRMEGAPREATDAAMGLASSMTGGDPRLTMLMAAHLDQMATGMNVHAGRKDRKKAARRSEGPAPVSIDMSEMLVERMLGPVEGKAGPLLADAARIVLIAADEARRAHAEYGRPRFLDDSMMSRNWMEQGTEIARQTVPIELR